jgi:hypothetical protein
LHQRIMHQRKNFFNRQRYIYSWGEKARFSHGGDSGKYQTQVSGNTGQLAPSFDCEERLWGRVKEAKSGFSSTQNTISACEGGPRYSRRHGTRPEATRLFPWATSKAR